MHLDIIEVLINYWGESQGRMLPFNVSIHKP